MSDDLARLADWVGRKQSMTEIIAPDRVAAMAATLDEDRAPAAGEALPPGWHWLFFNGAALARDLGPDGHPLKGPLGRGGFLPPVPLPRRMWAGGRLSFPAALRVGEGARRESEVAKVDVKKGKSGDLVFVTVRHRISGAAGLAVEEEHDIAYRPMLDAGAPSPKPQPAPAGAVWRRDIRPDPVLLFRYSALTFNGHRIHYDQPYVTGTEGYPGLVVHGPLIATLLLELIRREAPQTRLARFAYRAVAPLFDTGPFTVNGVPAAGDDPIRVWAAEPAGHLTMTAEAWVADGI
ncbi:MAG: MaoC family dehydratase N-terminal domain-containing protein [Rhodospirillales bacterium]|nr:MaoC family dehydratase N-terminal domain-containing protein [Rhodospirillales bacterium]